jgi:hypothetical protein
MNLYYTLFYFNSSLMAAIIIIKTILFFSRSHFRSFADWFWFDRYNIFGSRTYRVIRAKRTQNVLSFILIVLAVLDLLFLLLMHLA